MTRPDYDREPLEVYEEPTWTVLDPWTAQVRGVFYTEEDAQLFCKAVYRKFRKERKQKPS